MSETTISRRRALRTGGLAAIAASLLGTTTTAPGAGQTPAPTIDEAERLIVDLARILPHLSKRDGSNVGHVPDQLGRAAGSSARHLAQAVADALEDIGPGNRVHDRMDRDVAAEKRAAVTHAAVVARYAAAYHAGGTNAGTEIRAELASAYGNDLGRAIGDAAFTRYLHELHHDGPRAGCCAD